MIEQNYVDAEQKRIDSVRAVTQDLVSTVAAQIASADITENDHTAVSAHSIATRISELTTKLSTKLMTPEDKEMGEW
jgi:hypothetical protein